MPSKPILSQIESFGVFAVLMLALGSFEKTHIIAVYIIGIVAIAMLINLFKQHPNALGGI